MAPTAGELSGVTIPGGDSGNDLLFPSRCSRWQNRGLAVQLIGVRLLAGVIDHPTSSLITNSATNRRN